MIDMSVETMARLYELRNIAGVKDATANVARVSLQRQSHGAGLHPALRGGRDGARIHGLRRPWLHLRHLERGAGPMQRDAGGLPAWRLCLRPQVQDRLMPLHTALFIETNPSPAKYALSALGTCRTVPSHDPGRGEDEAVRALRDDARGSHQRVMLRARPGRAGRNVTGSAAMVRTCHQADQVPT